MPPAKKRKTRAAATETTEDTALDASPKFAIPSEVDVADAALQEDVAESAAQTKRVVDERAEPKAAEDSALPTAQATEPTPTSQLKTESTIPHPPPSTSGPDTASLATATADRLSRFRALQARAKSSSTSNLKAATTEAQYLSHDPSQLTAIHRKHAIASQKLLKSEIEEEGGDFERKRAWDWTVDESEAWDKRMAKKEAHKDDAAFQDYRRESQKVYKRQIKAMGAPDLEAYAKEKMKAVERAAAAGTLEIVETEEGELIAVDKDGTFYATADSTKFVSNKPDKAAVDKLVDQMKKADAAALRKRKERAARNGEDADVTYINEKNKVFNQRLSRFYNKYTKEIRDSFERGTMI